MFSFYLTSEIADDIVNIPTKYYNFFNLPVFLCFFSASVLFIFIFQYYNLYKANIFLTRANHLVQIIKSILLGILVLIIITFLFKLPFIPQYSRVFVLIYCGVSIFGFFIFRIYLLQILNSHLLNKTLLIRRIAIMGSGKTGKLLAEKFMFEDIVGSKIIGFIDDNIPKDDLVFNDLKCIGKISELENIVKEFRIAELIIAIDEIDYGNLLNLVDECSKLNVNIKISSPLFGIVPQKISIEEYGNMPVINVSHNFSNKFTLFLKRIFDLIASIILIIILSPVYIFIALSIKLTSKGEIIFSQIRIGKDGKPFKFYKFRSMTVNKGSDDMRKDMMLDFMKNDKVLSDGSMKIIDEQRVTKIGKIIRKTSLDELPQLFNVVKGDMSLVGPRPSLPYEYKNYDDWQKKRHSILPGCTGIWQVSGRSNVTFKDSVILDLFYVKNMTPWLDIQILLKTLPVMILSKGGK
jgi:exopolysaccharide biosynthesis polyprenyl glycosylphosphotransferase